MKYCETLYINCEDNGQIPELHNSHVMRLDDTKITPNSHAYYQLVFCLGELFHTAQSLQFNNILNESYSASIIVLDNKKFKESDYETNVERIKFIANNFIPPDKGIIISIYESNIENCQGFLRQNGDIMWTFKKQWNKDDAEDYVVLQGLGDVIDHSAHGKSKSIFSRIVNQIEELGINYKIIDYTTSIKETFDTLLKCKLLISYTGGPYFLAGGLNVPTLAFGENLFEKTNYYLNKIRISKPVDYKENRMAIDPDYHVEPKNLLTAWGISRTRHVPSFVYTYNEEKKFHSKIVDHVKNIGQVINEEDYDILKNSLLK